MKTVILAALTISLLLPLAGCGKKGELEPPEKSVTATQSYKQTD